MSVPADLVFRGPRPRTASDRLIARALRRGWTVRIEADEVTLGSVGAGPCWMVHVSDSEHEAIAVGATDIEDACGNALRLIASRWRKAVRSED